MPETRCPICNCHKGYVVDSMETCLCSHCGALFVYTPFGPELVDTNARDRFPEYRERYSVDLWENIDTCNICNEYLTCKQKQQTEFINKNNNLRLNDIIDIMLGYK